ncbi:hypothetical protein MNBD_GAMMA24-1998 [hydrothermal vent metagenome]|uniref:Uncharacterized protein n=1 Tax=hydrothermal vent metagenome TaxID=652676 RepID=A0A3B1B7U1_9ZZZZ
MIESLKKYVLLGFLISCLGLILYAMPDSPVVNEGINTGLQLSSNLN